MLRTGLVFVLLGFASLAAQQPSELPLSNGKSVSSAAPGTPQQLNTYPAEMAVSPDHQYVAILNNGYGSQESQYRQSIAVLTVATNQVRDFPDARLALDAPQTYFVGIAFSLDGKKLYASIASETDPEGKASGALGNGIVIYSFDQGKLEPERLIKLPSSS